MYVMGFPYVSLGNSTVQVLDNVGNRRECSCSEASFNSQLDDHA
jgi:hypothetical protein